MKMLRYAVVVVFVLCSQNGQSSPIVSDPSALLYLRQYGYLPPSNPSSSGLLSEDKMLEAVSDFQSFMGLNVTGKLDNATMAMMAAPRCGVKDKITPGDGRSKRYALQGSRWKGRNLTYKIKSYPNQLRRADVDEHIAKAFNVWSEYTDLTFTPTKSQAHIDIEFVRGDHGDGDPFDGPGGTLAHAYFPVYGGDAHFDLTERWSLNGYGTNLLQVAAHEFGHSLGLSHSDISQSLMAPTYKSYQPGSLMHEDDIIAIQQLYGKKRRETNVPRPTSTTARTSTGEENAELCNDPKIDTMFEWGDGTIFVFKGDQYWRLTEDGVAAGYPKDISKAWKGLPGDIDAAFTYKNGKTYFFKGSNYWRYRGTIMDGDYPKLISEGFTGIPDDIDAATVWTGNGKIYFYKGKKFWKFDPSTRPPVKSTYPKAIANWEGVPDNIDAAVRYKGSTYFFKNEGYYRFYDRNFAVDVANPAFPRSTGYWWFGCRSLTKGTLGKVHWMSGYPDNSFFYGNLEKVGGAKDHRDHDDRFHDDGFQADDIGDIVLEAGDSDEQLVTSRNRDVGNSGNGSGMPRNHLISTLAIICLLTISRHLLVST